VVTGARLWLPEPATVGLHLVGAASWIGLSASLFALRRPRLGVATGTLASIVVLAMLACAGLARLDAAFGEPVERVVVAHGETWRAVHVPSSSSDGPEITDTLYRCRYRLCRPCLTAAGRIGDGPRIDELVRALDGPAPPTCAPDRPAPQPAGERITR
jgi:hypothetical protein